MNTLKFPKYQTSQKTEDVNGLSTLLYMYMTYLKYEYYTDIFHNCLPAYVLHGIRGAVTKFPELWYNTVMVGHMKMLT